MAETFNRHIKHIRDSKSLLSDNGNPLNLKKDQYAIQRDDDLVEGSPVWRVAFRNSEGSYGDYIELATIQDRQGKNIFWGKDSGSNIIDTSGPDGLYNASLGYYAVRSITTGKYTSAIGAYAGDSITVQSGNTLLGTYSGDGIFSTVVTSRVLLNAGLALSIMEDLDGNVWIFPWGTPPIGSGMYRYNVRTKDLTFYSINEISDGNRIERYFLSGGMDRNGVPWALSPGGFYYFKKETNSWGKLNNTYGEPFWFVNDSSGNMWVLTWIAPRSGLLVKLDPDNKEVISTFPVLNILFNQGSIAVDSNDNIWLIHDGNQYGLGDGLLRFNTSTETFTEYSNGNSYFTYSFLGLKFGASGFGNSNIDSSDFLYASDSDGANSSILKIDLAGVIAGDGDAAITAFSFPSKWLGAIAVIPDGTIQVNDGAYISFFDEGSGTLIPPDTSLYSDYLNIPIIIPTVIIDGYYWISGTYSEGANPPQPVLNFIAVGDPIRTVLNSYTTPIGDNNTITGAFAGRLLRSSGNTITGDNAASLGELIGGNNVISGSNAAKLLEKAYGNILIGADVAPTLVNVSNSVIIGENGGAGLGTDASGILIISHPEGAYAPFIYGNFYQYSIDIGSQNTFGSSSFSAVFGYNNTLTADATFSAGSGNTISGPFSAIFGYNNTATGEGSFSAGSGNSVAGFESVVFGYGNTETGYNNFIGGGSDNDVHAVGSVALGESNKIGPTAIGPVGTVVVGNNNISVGGYSLISGAYNISSIDLTGLSTVSDVKTHYNVNNSGLIENTITRLLSINTIISSFGTREGFNTTMGAENINVGIGSVVSGQRNASNASWSIIVGEENYIFGFRTNIAVGQRLYIGTGDPSTYNYSNPGTMGYAWGSGGLALFGTDNQIFTNGGQTLNSFVYGGQNSLESTGTLQSSSGVINGTLLGGVGNIADCWSSIVSGNQNSIKSGVDILVVGNTLIVEQSSDIRFSALFGVANVVATGSTVYSTILTGNGNIFESTATVFNCLVVGTNHFFTTGNISISNIIGGSYNIIGNASSCLAMGYHNTISGDSRGDIVTGSDNIITGPNNSFVSGNSNVLKIASSGNNFISGTENTLVSNNSIVNGYSNLIGTGISLTESGDHSFVVGNMNVLASTGSYVLGEWNLVGDYTINGSDIEAGGLAENTLAVGISNTARSRASIVVGVGNTIQNGGIGSLPAITARQPWNPGILWDPQTNTLIDGVGTSGDTYVATQDGFVDFTTGSGSSTSVPGYESVSSGDYAVYDGSEWNIVLRVVHEDPDIINSKFWASYEIPTLYQDIGLASAAIGINNTVYSFASVALGMGLTAIYPYQTVLGKFNDIEPQLLSDESAASSLMIGNGSGPGSRGTSFGVLDNGTLYQNSIKVTGLHDTISKKIVASAPASATTVIDSNLSYYPSRNITYDYKIEVNNGGTWYVRSGTIIISVDASGNFTSSESSTPNLNGDPLVSLFVSYNGSNLYELEATNTNAAIDATVSLRKRVIF